jgi:hypothetical protein
MRFPLDVTSSWADETVRIHGADPRLSHGTVHAPGVRSAAASPLVWGAAPNPASSTSCCKVVASRHVDRKRQLVSASVRTWRASASARAASYAGLSLKTVKARRPSGTSTRPMSRRAAPRSETNGNPC